MHFRHRPALGRSRRFTAWAAPALLACALAAPALADDSADVLKLLNASRHAEALTRVDAAIASKPRDAQLRFLKGVILSETNKPAEAIAIFTRLTEEFPQLPEPWNNLAVLYAGQGQYDKARAALEKSIRTNPSYATAYENLGDIHAKLASLAYARALQVDAGNANVRNNPQLALVKSLGQVNSAPPRTLEPTPLPRPQSLPQSLPPSTPQPLPPMAQAPQAVAPPAATPQAPKPVAPQPATPPAAKPVAPQPATPPAARPTTPQPAQSNPPQPPKAVAPTAPSAPARAESENKSRASKQAEASREAVLATVHAWARDWSERDVKGYLSHYAPDFETPGRQSRKAWAEDRQARIVGKGRINVKVEAPQVSVDNGRATVKFRQQYSSDRLTVSSRKTLVLVQQKGRWLIQKESTGG